MILISDAQRKVLKKLTYKNKKEEKGIFEYQDNVGEFLPPRAPDRDPANNNRNYQANNPVFPVIIRSL